MVGERQIDHAYCAHKEGLYLERENGKRGDNRGKLASEDKIGRVEERVRETKTQRDKQ